MDKEQIIEIETTLAHHEQQITELNDVIYEQWKTIETLKAQINKLNAKIDNHSGEEGKDGIKDGIDFARSQIPPHY